MLILRVWMAVESKLARALKYYTCGDVYSIQNIPLTVNKMSSQAVHVAHVAPVGLTVSEHDAQKNMVVLTIHPIETPQYPVLLRRKQILC